MPSDRFDSVGPIYIWFIYLPLIIGHQMMCLTMYLTFVQGPDLATTSSELIYSGELTKISVHGWHQDRFFFLFDHLMVYLKKVCHSSLSCPGAGKFVDLGGVVWGLSL